MIVGEPEDTLLALSSLEPGAAWDEVPALTFRRDGQVVPATGRGNFARFLDAPFPAWDLLDLSTYRLPLVDKPYILVETSRGCPYSCDFCVAPIHQGHKFRERTPTQLVDEIERGYREFGLTFFYLWARHRHAQCEDLQRVLRRTALPGNYRFSGSATRGPTT